jgi:GDP-L-fucose synthase
MTNEGSLKDKRVVITGGQGFLGSKLVRLLEEENPKDLFLPSHSEYDFTSFKDCQTVTEGADLLIHLAAKVGGIGYNLEHPGELFYDNLMMGVQLMDCARKNNVGKFVGIGTICAYPKFTQVPFKEEDLWEGYPEETNAPYGLAKKMMLVQSQAYRSQYGFNSIFLLPVNLYGPNDNFDEKSSHVIPALIKKMVNAKKQGLEEVEIWGTGNASREFLYVDDCAKGILMASKSYNGSEPINLGASFEITIRDLANKIKDLTGYQGKLKWNSDKPDGQPRRCLDTSKAQIEFGFQAETGFEEGLKKTIDWYAQRT